MKALILAAGRGSRFRELTRNRPKALIPIAGIPLLGRVLQGLKEAGIQEVWIVTGYKAKMIKKEFGNNYNGLKINYIYAQNWKKGNLYSLLAAQGIFKTRFLLCMCDHVFEADLIKKLLSTNSKSTVVLAVDRSRCSPEDTKVLEYNGLIIKIGKTINPANAVDTGFFLCSPKIFKYATEAAQKGMTELANAIQLAAMNKDAQVVDVSGYFWTDVDTKQDLEYAEQFFLEVTQRKQEILPLDTYKLPKLTIPSNGHLEYQVFLGQQKEPFLSSSSISKVTSRQRMKE